MSETKHTPGPWHIHTEPQPHGCPIVGNGRGLMLAMLAHSVNYPGQRDEANANARLIAAAPELLEAGKSVISWTEAAHRPPIRDDMEFGRMVSVRLHALADLYAAISKAEGREA